MAKAAKHQVIGKSHHRVDGVVKATGKAVYAMDLELPGMLHAKVLRSPFPHARLVRVDATKAAALPGVVTVLTRETLDGMNPYFGSAYKDQTIVALDKVRYDGDPVAAVAANDEATAAEALALIETEYEELPAVTDVADAIAPGAPLVHEQVADADELHGHAYRVPEEFRGTNVCYAYNYSRGDVDKGFVQADEVFEDVFTFPQVQHYPLEPHITIAAVEDGHVTLWSSTQDPFTLQRHIAEFFSIPINRVRVIVPHIGGAYGGKLSVKNEPLVAALAWKTGRTVKITHTSEETFRTITRHPARFRIKTGVTRDGKLVARECEVHMGTGAYADYGPRVSQKAGYRAPGPYRIPNVKVDAYTVYTNAVPAGAFRGFGTLQVTWAYESQMDMIARRLEIDPLEFRVRNLMKKGGLFTKGDSPVDCDLEAGLRRTAKALGWGKKRKEPNRGMGLACCMKDGGGTYKVASASIKLNSDGSAVLFTGTVEIGQGCRTALAQVAAEGLSLPYEAVTVAQLDTDSTP
ncbi:MAG: molybdopterin-dependent oxidoreductase, partial [Deltaproteobacteria bacterium]|nr:molybdopterin-dependent oxidoreductase [Deltaproteobacteria bacterium]